MANIIPQEGPLKQCVQCLNSYPATLAYFHKGSKYNKMGLATKCKRCKGKGTNFGKMPEPREYRDTEKKCPRCEQWLAKNTNNFGIDNGRKDGFNPVCKTCLDKDRVKRKDKIDQQQYRYKINNKERIRERDRTHYKENRERELETTRRSYQKHRSKRLAYAHQYIVSHTEKCRANGRHHYNMNKEQYFANCIKRKARKQSVGGEYTPAQIQDLLKRQKYSCYYAACGFAKFQKTNGKYVYHVEHTYPISRVAGTDIPANNIGYIVLACPSCNLSKHNKFPWEWPEGGRLL